MAVTQYIGARYVPLFADPLEWDTANTYEPLTIVLHEGNSFTSRQYVPAGIDIDNTDYWAETGNYNAQIEQYRLEVAQYVEQVETFADDIERSVKYDVNITTVQPEAPYDNADTFPTNTVIRIAQSAIAQYVQNLPVTDEYMIVLTVGATDIAGSVGNAQIALIQNADNDMYWRSYGTEWNEWSRVADYNDVQDAITQMQSDLNDFKDEVNEDFSSFQTTINSTLSDMDETIADNLETSLTGKTHIVCIGDSFTSEWVREYSWPAQLPSIYTVHNYASGGTGFLTTGSQTTGESNKTFPQQAEEAADDDSYDHGLVKTVIIYGGYNDMRAYADDITSLSNDVYSDMRAAINTTAQTCYRAFPGANIIVVIGNNGFGNRANANYYAYFNNGLMRGTAQSQRYTMVNAMYWLYGFGEETVFNDDGLHPSQQGAAIIARYMNDLINGCFNPGSINFETRLASGEDGNQQDDLVAVFNPLGEFRLKGHYTFTISSTGDNYTTISSIADGRFMQYYGQTCIPLNVFGNSQYITGSYLNPSNGRLHCMVTNTSSSGSCYY